MVLGGRYRVDALLAHGGMGDVYRGTDDVAGTPVAIKVLRHLAAEQARRFATEARTLERLDHPAIVRFCESGADGTTPYLVMEYVDGPTLAEVLAAEGPLSVERAAVMGMRLADGLAHAHHLGIVHRDVKPGNVLVGSDGLARLADFGIARLTDATTLTQTGWLVGTASYLAPEQLEGRHVGPRADVYSLGLVLLEATTGRRAYDGSPTEAAMARLVREPEIPDTLPAWWRALMRDMTALGPDFRPAAADVAERLREVQASEETTTIPIQRDPTATMRLPVVEQPVEQPAAPPAAPPVPARRRGAPTWAPAVVVAAVVVGLVLLGLLLGGGGDGASVDDPDLPPALRDALEQLEAEVGS